MKEEFEFLDPEQSGETLTPISKMWAGVRRNPDDENYEKFREQYLALIEAKYQEFITSNGQVAPGNLQEFLVLQSKYIDFLKEYYKDGRDNLPVGYDMGYRFLVDALLNQEPQLTAEEIGVFRELFEQSAPYYNNAGSQQIESRFAEEHSDERFKETTKCLIKKAVKQYDVSQGRGFNDPELVKYHRSTDILWNPSLRIPLRDLLCEMEGITDFEAKANLEGKIFSEARKELREELQ